MPSPPAKIKILLILAKYQISPLPAFLDMVKNVAFSQQGKISPASLDKMALASAKIKIRIRNYERMAPDNKY